MFVIKKGDLYVARPGSDHSYTKDIDKAQQFTTREEAERSRCPGNERIVQLRMGWVEWDAP